MILRKRIATLSQLGKEILSRPEWLDEAVQKAYYANKWFTVDQSWQALESIATYFLDQAILEGWAAGYNLDADVSPKRVGLVLAGNIPLVGFHDMLCCFVAGHISVVKLSSKDEILPRALVEKLIDYDNETSSYFELAERLNNFEAVIATGSNNSAAYFEEYFGKYPNIIRKNRNAVAVLTGEENREDFVNLGNDIFNYFGLGCRNVSKLYVPKDYKFDDLLETLHDEYKHLANHDKYRNNFDYNNSLFLLNKRPFLMSGSLIITESDAIASRISTVHYSYYSDLDLLSKELIDKKDEIQCVVSRVELRGSQVFNFGQAQSPSISDYADGVDTMQFLKTL